MINQSILNVLKEITTEEKQILNGKAQIDRDIYMLDDSVVSANKLLENTKTIAIRPHTRFAHFPKHTHDYIEVVYVCSGSLTHVLNGTKITLKAGELLFLSQGTTQEILPAKEDDIAVNFIIRPQFFDKTLEMLGQEDSPLKRFLIDCLTQNSYSIGYLHFKVANIIPVQNLIENLILTVITNTPNKRNINQTTMGLLFTLLLNYTNKLSYESKEEEAVFKIFNYIEENYSNGSLQEAAKLFHYDFYWLSKEIKSKTGKTYTQLLQEKRLSKTAYLLKNTNLNISEIANLVGYSNISYFHKIFNNYFGVSPKNYRACK